MIRSSDKVWLCFSRFQEEYSLRFERKKREDRNEDTKQNVYEIGKPERKRNHIPKVE